MGDTTQLIQPGTTKNAADERSNLSGRHKSFRRFPALTPTTTVVVILSLLFAFRAPVGAQRIHEPVHVEQAPHAPAAEEAAGAAKEGEKADEESKPGNKTAENLAEALVKNEREFQEGLQKQHEERVKYYERYSTPDREYFVGWLSAGELKKPFNQLVDEAIVSIRARSSAKTFKNAGSQQIVEALSSQSQALPPPERFTLKLHEHWLLPDTLDVAKAGSSTSATVLMYSLKDYVSDAIDKLHYPPPKPTDAGTEFFEILRNGKDQPNQPTAAPTH